MADEESYTKKGLLVRRPESPFWYMRFTSPSNGRRIFRSTKSRDFDEALRLAEEAFSLESGAAPDKWRRYVSSCMADSRSWLRETIRKVRSRSEGKATVSVDAITAVAIRSGGRCELTGVPFSLDNPTGSNVAPFRPSLDRIDSSLPYSYQNCRLIIVAANLALRDWGDHVFKTMCIGYATQALRRDCKITDANFVAPLVSGVGRDEG